MDKRILFFFQAEDGIRDDLVTGVQTCALPISYARVTTQMVPDPVRHHLGRHPCVGRGRLENRVGYRDVHEIGRASCRERCRSRVSAYSVNKKQSAWEGLVREVVSVVVVY